MTDQYKINWREKFLVPAVLSLCIGFIISVFGPLEIIMNNYSEFSFGLSSMLGQAFFGAVVIAGILFIPFLLLNKTATKIYEVLLLTGIVAFTVNSHFLYGSYGDFDGRGLTIVRRSTTSIMQILLVLGVFTIALLRKSIFKKIYLFAIIFSVALFFASVVQFFLNGFDASRIPQNISESYFQFSADGKSPNYLYLILDEVYGQSAKQILVENKDIAEKFEGFTNYDNVSGVYPTTIMSIPLILSGKTYKEFTKNTDHYEDSFKNSYLLNHFKSNDVSYHIHSMYLYCQNVLLGNCSTWGTIIPTENEYGIHSEYVNALNLSLFRIVPDVLKSKIYNEDNWFVKEWKAKHNPILTESQDINEFLYFIDNMKLGAEKSSFKMFHSKVTHSPIRYDSDCTPFPKTLDRTYSNFLKQDACGFNLVGKLIDKLKKLKVYDNTLIVISSDHGRSVIPEELESAFNVADEITPRVYGYAHATLMVKPINASGALKHSGRALSLGDLGKFFVDQEFINENEYDKKRKYFDYKWDGGLKSIYLTEFTNVYNISNEDIKDPQSWNVDNDEMNKILAERNVRKKRK